MDVGLSVGGRFVLRVTGVGLKFLKFRRVVAVTGGLECLWFMFPLLKIGVVLPKRQTPRRFRPSGRRVRNRRRRRLRTRGPVPRVIRLFRFFCRRMKPIRWRWKFK